MDRDKIVKTINEELHIELHDWQIAFIFNESDNVVSGRATGKTIAYMLRMLLSKGEPIHQYKVRICNDYDQWYARELRSLYCTLSNPCLGLELRKIYFNRKEVSIDEKL